MTQAERILWGVQMSEIKRLMELKDKCEERSELLWNEGKKEESVHWGRIADVFRKRIFRFSMKEIRDGESYRNR